MKIQKVKDVRTPERGTQKSAGLDFFMPNTELSKRLYPGQSIVVPSGIRVDIPKGHVLIGFNKSGVAVKKGLQVGACVIDEDFQGEIHIHLTNVSGLPCSIEPGDKIVQFVLLPVCYPTVELVDDIHPEPSERGHGKFGSTDVEHRLAPRPASNKSEADLKHPKWDGLASQD